jgi:multiple sugar transport system permease protein
MAQKSNYRLMQFLGNSAVYVILTFFALVMLFPFMVMVSTSLKEPGDSFSYPPRLLPRDAVTTTVEGFADPLPLYFFEINGERKQFALAEKDISIGIYAPADNLSQEIEIPQSTVKPTGGVIDQQKITVNGEEKELWDVDVNGQVIPMILVRQTVKGRFVNPQNPSESTLGNVRLSEPVTNPSWHPENYVQVTTLSGISRSLTNTMLVTVLVVTGQLTTSVVGGYAFARLRFPGRNNLFVVYLGTIMIPFVVLIIPLYQLMVLFGWVNSLAALIIPWVFTAYGTFLMRQFFITVPKEIEEAALIDGASRIDILRRIFIPASVPALATQATFSFLYAWNSFIWPLLIINTGNENNHVLTLTLSILRGRAVEAPNLILAAAAISVLPPLIVFIFAQRFYIESVTSSGVKG